MTDMIEVLDARFHALYLEAEAIGLEKEFLSTLENEYGLFDFERARDIVREETP